LTLGVAAERRSEFGIYTREAVGGNLDVTLNPRGRLPVTFGYSYSVGSTQATDAEFCSQYRLCDSASRAFLKNRRQFGAVSVTVVRNLVNALLDPSEGSLMSVSVLHASRLFGSQPPYEFNRAEAEIARYHSIGRRTVFAWRIRGGVILPNNIDLAGQNVGYVPPDQRFYGGGPTSVRGYGRNELGPRAYVTTQRDSIDILPSGDTVWKYVTTAPTGGNTVFILNAELRLPSPILSQRMRLGLFVDAGQVWARGEERNISGLRFTPGMGVRFATPLGPVRFDAAYNGYPLERGPLLYQPPAPGPIIVIDPDYPPINAPKSFWQKVVVQLSVGHAF